MLCLYEPVALESRTHNPSSLTPSTPLPLARLPVTREERFHVARLSDGRWELLAKVVTCRSEEQKHLRERLTLRLKGTEALEKGDLALATTRSAAGTNDDPPSSPPTLPTGSGGGVFPGAACVAALIDRFAQHCHVIDIDADSWRNKEASTRTSTKKR